MARAKRREEQPHEGSGSHTFDDSVIGPSCPLSFCGKIERMASHVHAVAAEGHALRLEPHALLQTPCPGNRMCPPAPSTRCQGMPPLALCKAQATWRAAPGYPAARATPPAEEKPELVDK